MTSLSSEFSVFSGVKGTVPKGTITLPEMVERIRSDEFRSAVEAIRAAKAAGNDDVAAELKKNLQAVTFSGVFTKRKSDALQTHSGLLGLDFDDLVPESLQALKAQLSVDPHVQASFVSPGRAGLKVVVPIQADAPTHGASFAMAAAYFKAAHGLEADQSGKDVSRLCFLSYDQDAFLREGDAIAFVPAAEFPKPIRAVAATPPNREEIQSALNALDPDIDYGQWIRIGMAVHSAMPGDDGLEIWESWSTGGTKFKAGECTKHWSGFRSGEITIATLFGLARDAGWRRILTMGPKGVLPSTMPTAPVVAAPSPNADIRAKLWAIAQIPKLSAPERSQQIAAAVLEWLHGRGQFYFHADHADFASVMFFDNHRKLLLPVQSDSFLAWLSDCLAINRADRTFTFVQSSVETEGLSERAMAIEPSTFWAARPGVIYLSSGPGHMARVTAEGVTMVDNGTDGILFPCGATLAPWSLVEPQDPFETCRLFRDMSTSAPHGRDLFMIWTMSLPTNQRTKPPLVISGDVGSGKTRLIRGVFELFGIPERITAVLKDKEDDFWSGANAGGLICPDNADTKVEWFPDALAIASTGGSREKRKLYTDSDNVILKARAWVCVTSANPSFASDAGLADRLLVVRLDRRKGNTAETTLSDEINQNRDAGLSFIAHSLSRALADQEPVPGGLNSRHPDFAQMGARIGRAVGRGNEALMALRAAEADKGMFSIENDSIGAALLEFVRAGSFKGTAAELVVALTRVDPTFAGKLSPKTLSKRMSKLWPHLERVFRAAQERDTHTKMLNYTLQPPESAVIAVIEKPLPVNPPRKNYIKSLPKVLPETPQSPQTNGTTSLNVDSPQVDGCACELDWSDEEVRVA